MWKQSFLYGYFFFDDIGKKLENLGSALEEKSFKIVSIEEKEKNIFQLHVEKIQIHSKESLLKQLIEFDELALSVKIKAFDGWDIGNIDVSKPLISNQLFENNLASFTNAEVYGYAVQLLEAEIFDKAIIAFDKSIANAIETENSLYKQFICYDYLGDAENVLLKLKAVLEINPNHFKACYNIGAVSYDLGNFENSVKYYEKASKIKSNDDSVFYGISLSQYCLGNMAEAEINCKKALEINSENQNAKELLIMIEN